MYILYALISTNSYNICLFFHLSGQIVQANLKPIHQQWKSEVKEPFPAIFVFAWNRHQILQEHQEFEWITKEKKSHRLQSVIQELQQSGKCYLPAPKPAHTKI